MISSKEIVVPYIVEDFEEGDRVYRHTTARDYTLFGTVKAVEASDLIVVMDNVLELKIPIRLFKQRSNRSFYWGKPLPLSQVEKGSVISVEMYGSKMTATVNNVTTDSITFTYNEGHRITNTYTASKENSLESLLMFWELED